MCVCACACACECMCACACAQKWLAFVMYPTLLPRFPHPV